MALVFQYLLSTVEIAKDRFIREWNSVQNNSFIFDINWNMPHGTQHNDYNSGRNGFSETFNYDEYTSMKNKTTRFFDPLQKLSTLTIQQQQNSKYDKSDRVIKMSSINNNSKIQVMMNNKSRCRIVVMGAAGVGKSAIISQFLYDSFRQEYNKTIEELHQGEYDFNGLKLTLDILDTAGAYSFPAMRQLAISTSDAFVLVYSVNDESSFDAVTQLREQILVEKCRSDVPIVIVANKVDVGDDRRTIDRITAESIVCVEWGNGYVEASAKDNFNIVGIFKEILRQSNVHYALSPAVRRRRRLSAPSSLSEKKKKTARQTRSQRSSCS